MPLTDVAIRNAKPRENPYKMGDALGLFLLVQPTGAKLWRLKYRIHGREKKVALGKYPEICLADARNRTREAREQLVHGLDPAREKQKAKLRAQLEANNTFSAIAKEYCEKRKPEVAKAWASATSRRCEYLLSLLSGSIGNRFITDVEPIDVLQAVRRNERQGKHEISRRNMQLAGAVFRYAVATARVKSDPTRNLCSALMVPTVIHYGAVIEPDAMGGLLRSIDAYNGQPITGATSSWT
jgi:Arm DNA-binding domain